MAKKVSAQNLANGAGTPGEEAPKRIQVSQADIPAYSLDEALRVPRAIVENYNGKPATPLKVAAAMKIGPATGPFKMLTGASIAYGLTNGGGQSAQIELTPLCQRILKPKKEGDDNTAKREAFLKPRVIGQFLRQYDGGPIPRKDIALNVLSDDMGVPEKRAAAVFDMILEGAGPLGLLTTINGKVYVSLDGVGAGASAEEQYDPDEPIEELDKETREEEETVPPAKHPTTASIGHAVAETNKRVFITHGKNKEFLDPIKKLISYGKYVPVVAVEKTSVSKPMPDKVMGMMRSCGAAIIHVDVDQVVTDENKTQHIILNPNVLIEIGAAQALYGRRFILLVRDGLKLPSNLQGLSEVRYSGEKMDSDVTLALLDALQDIQNYELPDRYKSNETGESQS